MSKDEFIRLHGEDIWTTLVEPMADANANGIVHYDIIRTILEAIGLPNVGILDARQKIKDWKEK